MARGFVYLVAIADWFGRRVLAWHVSILLDATFCIEALARHGRPTIFNSLQQRPGSNLTNTALHREHIAISMDGKGRWRDNVFVENLWRSMKYEEVHLAPTHWSTRLASASAATSASTMPSDCTRRLVAALPPKHPLVRRFSQRYDQPGDPFI
jgi:transposase InsO family protein